MAKCVKKKQQQKRRHDDRLLFEKLKMYKILMMVWIHYLKGVVIICRQNDERFAKSIEFYLHIQTSNVIKTFIELKLKHPFFATLSSLEIKIKFNWQFKCKMYIKASYHKNGWEAIIINLLNSSTHIFI